MICRNIHCALAYRFVTVNTHDRSGGTLSQATQNKIIYQTKDYTVELKKADELIDQIIRENAKKYKHRTRDF